MCVICVSGACPPGLCPAAIVYSPFDFFKMLPYLVVSILGVIVYKIKHFLRR